MRSVFALRMALGLLAPVVAGGALASKAAARRAPDVVVQLIEGSTPRLVVGCRGEGPNHVELEGAASPYGARPLGAHAVASLPRRDGQATCALDDEPSIRNSLRLRPLQLSAVTPKVVRDASARLVVSIDGQALTPKVAADDGVYLVARGRLIAMAATCPEARFTEQHVVACVDLGALTGVDRAWVRLQSAGRLEQAPGAPLDVAGLVAR